MIKNHKVVSRETWIEARKKLLAKEKRFTRLRDDLSRQRRELPWVKVTKPYVFEGPKGKESFSDLFAGRRQLIVYHFMFAAGWDGGCPHCSFWADNFDKIIVHLNHRDTTMIAVSSAPYAQIAAYKKRMGWSFKWVSSAGNAFNRDYNVAFTPEEMERKKGFYNYKMQDPLAEEREGTSVFYKGAKGAVFHTYSAFARGIDMLNVAYHYLDLTPQGRDEAGHEFPQFWVRRHDEYED